MLRTPPSFWTPPPTPKKNKQKLNAQDTSSLLDWVAELDYLMHSTLKQLPDAVTEAR